MTDFYGQWRSTRWKTPSSGVIYRCARRLSVTGEASYILRETKEIWPLVVISCASWQKQPIAWIYEEVSALRMIETVEKRSIGIICTLTTRVNEQQRDKLPYLQYSWLFVSTPLSLLLVLWLCIAAEHLYHEEVRLVFLVLEQFDVVFP